MKEFIVILTVLMSFAMLIAVATVTLMFPYILAMPYGWGL